VYLIKHRAIKTHVGGIYSCIILDVDTDGGEWFTSRKSAPCTPWIGSWVSPTAGLNSVTRRKISCLCRKSKPGYPACLYTNWANLAPQIYFTWNNKWPKLIHPTIFNKPQYKTTFVYHFCKQRNLIHKQSWVLHGLNYSFIEDFTEKSAVICYGTSTFLILSTAFLIQDSGQLLSSA
jgi:hypothetical protein